MTFWRSQWAPCLIYSESTDFKTISGQEQVSVLAYSVLMLAYSVLNNKSWCYEIKTVKMALL